MTFLYFAYGSNLLSQRMRINCPSARHKCIAELKKFKLAFWDFACAWHGAVATVMESEKDSVWGVVWEISKEHEENLNRQENVYKPIIVKVTSPEYTEVECKTYQKLIDNDEEYGRPSLVYKKVILQGAVEHKLPLHYIQKLEAIVDNGYKGPVGIPVDIKL